MQVIVQLLAWKFKSSNIGSFGSIDVLWSANDIPVNAISIILEAVPAPPLVNVSVNVGCSANRVSAPAAVLHNVSFCCAYSFCNCTESVNDVLNLPVISNNFLTADAATLLPTPHIWSAF